jgi:oligoribonuclease NrnB/cAMP/cGMP phosphodiesterase (DHH superfamily)
MKIFYHADMDGHCAAAIVHKFYNGDGEYISINYNQDFPFDEIKKDELIIIVDYSLQKKGEFEKLFTITKQIIWIDHHKTAIEQSKEFADSKIIRGIRQDGVAGCELTWKFFFPKEPVPYVVLLLGDYDIWAYKYGDNTQEFQACCKLFDTSPYSTIWEKWLNYPYIPYDEMRQGEIISKFQKQNNASLLKVWSFTTIFEGYKAICCNQGSSSSLLFASAEEEYDLMIPFVFDGKLWSVSLYTTNKNIDVSEIAKKYGGGGHKNAAGFQIAVLPFNK